MRYIEINSDILNRLLLIGENLSSKLLGILSDQEMKTHNKWLDNQDVCMVLNVSKRKLQYLRSSGQIAYFKLDNKIYYKEADIREYLEKHKK